MGEQLVVTGEKDEADTAPPVRQVAPSPTRLDSNRITEAALYFKDELGRRQFAVGQHGPIVALEQGTNSAVSRKNASLHRRKASQRWCRICQSRSMSALEVNKLVKTLGTR